MGDAGDESIAIAKTLDATTSELKDAVTAIGRDVTSLTGVDWVGTASQAFAREWDDCAAAAITCGLMLEAGSQALRDYAVCVEDAEACYSKRDMEIQTWDLLQDLDEEPRLPPASVLAAMPPSRQADVHAAYQRALRHNQHGYDDMRLGGERLIFRLTELSYDTGTEDAFLVSTGEAVGSAAVDAGLAHQYGKSLLKKWKLGGSDLPVVGLILVPVGIIEDHADGTGWETAIVANIAGTAAGILVGAAAAPVSGPGSVVLGTVAGVAVTTAIEQHAAGPDPVPPTAVPKTWNPTSG